MEESNKIGKLWAIGTFIRILPNIKNAKTLIEYAHEEVNIAEGNNRGVLQIKIPDDADPGISHNNATGILEYEFDKVFDAHASQSDVFDSIAREKILHVFDGINSTIFAYGQTGSGKTFTIFGGESFADRGLIPRSIAFLFKERRARELTNFIVKVQVSFTEVYKETVYDLLDKQKKNLPIEQWTPVQVLEGENGLTLRNLNVFEVETEDDALSLFFLGNKNRLTSSTVMNDASSRSHAIFTMIIESKGMKNGKTMFTCGKMNFVDLAGSERIYKITSAGAKEMIEEAKSINLSLHYLENVIVSLRDQSNNMQRSKLNHSNNHGHIPYRNCILTSILRDSLGGNCRSGFILTLAMDRRQFEESVSTCRFGQRCGEAKVTVHANAEVSLADQVKDLNGHIKQLERQIHVLEEEKASIANELVTSKEYWQQVWEPRTLSPQEKVNCKLCVQNLFASAKESIALSLYASNLAEEAGSGHGSAHGGASPLKGMRDCPKVLTAKDFEQKESLSSELEHFKTSHDSSACMTPCMTPLGESDGLIERSQEELYLAVVKMDRAVLIELSIALGGLVQTMYLEREKAKAEDHRRMQRKSRIIADKEARVKAKLEADAEEKTKLLAIEREVEMKAQRDADEIEFMLSQVAATIARPSPKAGNTRMPSLQTSLQATSGNNSPCPSDDNSAKHSPAGGTHNTHTHGTHGTHGTHAPHVNHIRERTDYGLSKETLSMLVTGATFNVPNFLGLKTPKFFYVTTDIANIAHRSSKGNHQTATPFEKYESAELVKNAITLKGKNGFKSLHIEYSSGATSEENQAAARYWRTSLGVCIDRANGKKINSTNSLVI